MKLQKIIRSIFALACIVCVIGLVYSIGAIEHGAPIGVHMLYSIMCLAGMWFFGQVWFD